MSAELVARIDSLKKRVETLEARERPRVPRGWKDDFMGQALHEQYAPVSNGAGSSGALQNNAHGGIYRLTGGAGAYFNHALWLGDGADGHATLDADSGWVMMTRAKISHTTNIIYYFGASDAGANNRIRAGFNTDLFGNWVLQTRMGGGVTNNVDSEVAADTDMHSHRLEVAPISGGLRQVDYFLDGTRIATTTVSVPTAVLTPNVCCYATAVAARYSDLDRWRVIPS